MGIVKTYFYEPQEKKEREEGRDRETEDKRKTKEERHRPREETNRHRVKEANTEDRWAGRHMTNKQTDGERGGG